MAEPDPLLAVHDLRVETSASSNVRARNAGWGEARPASLVERGRAGPPLIDGVSLSIGTGETVGLVGESGCGKSLTALSILRLLRPPLCIGAGRILYRGVDLLALPEARLREVRGRRIAMIFQEPSAALDPVLTIGDQIAEPLVVHERMARGEARRRAVELLRRVGVPAPEERARAYPHELSGGLRQRAVIAMALACRPELLLADEPTSALDAIVQAQILALLGELRRELGMAMLLVSHDLAVVAETCDRIVVLYAGRVVEEAPAAALLRAPRHPYTAALLRSLPRDDGQAGARARLPELPGLPPAPSALPTGCRFADRCPVVAEAESQAGEPRLLVRPPGRSSGRCAVVAEAESQAGESRLLVRPPGRSSGRCASARERCRTEEPPLAAIAGEPGRLVRCFYPEGAG